MPVKKKKQSKSKKLLNWLNPSTPAKSMLLFALAFGVIGGSVALYKSFAYTYSNHSWTYYSNNPGEITLRSGSAVLQTDSHGGLPNTKVWRLERNAVVGAKISVYSASVNRSIKECVRFRYTNGTSNNHFWYLDGSQYTDALTGSYTYTTRCGPYHTVHFPGTFDEKILNDTSSQGDLYIQWIGIVW